MTLFFYGVDSIQAVNRILFFTIAYLFIFQFSEFKYRQSLCILHGITYNTDKSSFTSYYVFEWNGFSSPYNRDRAGGKEERKHEQSAVA